MIHFLESDVRDFPDHLVPDQDGLVALGGNLAPRTLITAYQSGAFPWSGELPIPWFSPDPRLILRPKALRISRSLGKAMRRGDLEVRFDHDFFATIRACATVPRPEGTGTWIKENMVRAYGELHRLGIVHSVETYVADELVGGLYGLALGRGFFGESMFARRRDASKTALVALCGRLAANGYHFIDCQQVTGHLSSLGAIPIPRREYLERLALALGCDSEHHSWGSHAS